jgi:hypothetical protein
MLGAYPTIAHVADDVELFMRTHIVCGFVSACEAENRFLSPVVPFRVVTAPFYNVLVLGRTCSG